jgi:hypothetical protein
MTLDPKSPFNWYLRTEPSIFAQDAYFRPKGAQGRTGSQIMTEYVEKKRSEGIEPGSIIGLGKLSKEKEERLLAYKHFGTYSKAKPTKKPNKHEK